MAAEQQEYQVTARKWRPTEFNSVVGQEHVTQTLKNAIRNGRLHHAYLFSGPRGVGKTTTARILAKALNCQNRGEDFEPCGVCDSCRQITEGRSLDVVEIDGASNNSVEDIRKLRDNAKYPPVAGSYKLYVIDEVHMLSTSAFNALLKTLEEPPKHLIFIFATTEPHKVPATILSRCQRFDFRRHQINDIVGRLSFIAQQEGMTIDEDALIVIAKKGDGSMRDSQSIFDQVRAFCGQNISYQQVNEALNVIDQGFFFRVTDMMRSHDASQAFAVVDEIMRTGYDAQEFLIGLAEHFRNFLTVITTGSTRLIEAAKTYLDRYDEESKTMEQGDVIRALHLTLAAQQAIRTSSQPRLRLELALIQLAVMDSTISLTELLNKIDRMPEGGVSASAPAPSPSPATASASVPASTPAKTATPQPPPPTEPKGGYASMIRESVEKGDGKGRSIVKDLAEFPKNAPPVSSMQGSFIADADVATLSNGGRATYSYNSITDVEVASTVVAEGADDPVLAQRARPSVTIGDVQDRWMEFVQSFDDKKTLASALQQAQVAEVQGNALRIYVPKEFELAMLMRYKDMVNEKLSTFFDCQLYADCAMGVAPKLIGGDEKSTNGSASGMGDLHPFVQGMVEKLGASLL